MSWIRGSSRAGRGWRRTPNLSAPLLTLLCVCVAAPAVAGIFIGNPGIVEANALHGARLVEASGLLDAVELDDCHGGTWSGPVEEEIDLVRQVKLDLPHGEWCALRLILDDGLYLVGEAAEPFEELVKTRKLSLDPSGDDLFILSDIGASSAVVEIVAWVEG